MIDWNQLIDQENNNNDYDHDHFELPPPQTIDLNASGTRQKEIIYKFAEDNPEKIVRIEQEYDIINTKKKVSMEAINRRRNWVKFGDCKNVPNGQIEKGITNQREEYFQFMWTGEKKKKIASNTKNKKQPHKTSKFTPFSDDIKEETQINDTSSNLTRSTSYRPPQKRADYDDMEPVEIKISNLPQWADWNDVKQIIDAFYRNHLKERYIPKYRIKMIPSRKTLEEWKKYQYTDSYYAERLKDYDRMAIVEFDSADKAEKAIKTLNGHRYEYNVLQVEKAKPRNINISR